MKCQKRSESRKRVGRVCATRGWDQVTRASRQGPDMRQSRHRQCARSTACLRGEPETTEGCAELGTGAVPAPGAGRAGHIHDPQTETPADPGTKCGEKESAGTKTKGKPEKDS